MIFWSRPSFWLLTEKELRLTGPPHRTLTNILYSFDYDVRKSKSDFNAKPHGLSENIPYPAINYFYFRVDIISFCSGVFLTKSSVLKLIEHIDLIEEINNLPTREMEITLLFT